MYGGFSMPSKNIKRAMLLLNLHRILLIGLMNFELVDVVICDIITNTKYLLCWLILNE